MNDFINSRVSPKIWFKYFYVEPTKTIFKSVTFPKVNRVFV